MKERKEEDGDNNDGEANEQSHASRPDSIQRERQPADRRTERTE